MTQPKYNHVDGQYLSFMGQILKNGIAKGDRTGTGTYSLFGHQMRFDLRKGLPLLTTKKVHLKSIIHELLWFLKGETNIKYLKDNGVNIWNEWSNEEGELGPVYGAQWRAWQNIYVQEDVDGNTSAGVEFIDQLGGVIHTLKTNPTCRRLLVSAWNPAVLPRSDLKPWENASVGLQALPPCHTLFQFIAEPLTPTERSDHHQQKFLEKYMNNPEWKKKVDEAELDYMEEALSLYNTYVGETRKENQSALDYLDAEGVPKYYLSSQMYQRSADWFLGVPFNIASYAILTQIIGKLTNMIPKDFVHTFGDAHLYQNHLDQCKEQLSRVPYQTLPTLTILGDQQTLEDFKYEDFVLENYLCHPSIKAPISV